MINLRRISRGGVKQEDRVPKFTRESLLDVGKVVVAGNAIRLTVTISDSVGEKASDALAYLREREQVLAQDVRRAIRSAFKYSQVDILKFNTNRRGYILASIRFADSSIQIGLYGNSTEASSGGNYGGERWVRKADEFQFLMQKHIQSMLDANPALRSVSIDTKWEPGDGLLCSDYLVDPGTPDPLLSAELRRLRDRERRFRRYRTIYYVTSFLVVTAVLLAFFLVYKNSSKVTRSDNLFLTGVFAIYFVVPLIIYGITFWANYGGERQEIDRKEAILDLRSVLGEDEQNAYKLFQVNSTELKRYYDQALSQRALVFSLGIFCILAGFAVIGVTLYILAKPLAHAEPSQRTVVAVLGAVGAILADFIAVIYLQMFRSIVASMVDFHNRLVLTHHIYFGNLLLARVSDEALKEETLSRLALTLSNLYGPEIANKGADSADTPTKGKGFFNRKGAHSSKR
jgi:hypothetical protein